MKPISLAFALALLFFTSHVARADDEPLARPSKAQVETIVSSLKWQTGAISIKDGLAKINLTPEFRFLDSADARKVLHDVWNNPDDPDLLGMIFPADKGPLDDEGWAVTINYENGGYVKDDDAGKINYDDLLKTMQKDTHEANPDREKEGYPTMELVGWAAPPRYDKAAHKLYWAKELKVNGDTENTLNYDIRILGRHGVLVLGAIAGMKQFPEIDKKTPELLAMVDFQPGSTYGEFDPKIDKVAEYGLGALVAGGALAGAAKLGLFAAFFKWGLAAILALKKALIFVIVGIVAGVKKLWSKMTGGGGVTTKTLTPPDNRPPGS